MNGVKIRRTFDISQAITEGFFETRSKEKTLFFTLLAILASPEPISIPLTRFQQVKLKHSNTG